MIISSVRSSYSHPDLLLINHHPPHFFRSHRSSTTTLDFHFLSHLGMTWALLWQNLARLWHTLANSGILWRTLTYSGIL